VYAAVAPAEGKMTSLILPRADTAMMNLFLEPVAKTFQDYFIVMQVDQAAWHHAKELQVPENIRLIPQPPYSPELNPVEHVWEHLREKRFAHLACSSLEEVVDKLCEELTHLEAEPEQLRSLIVKKLPTGLFILSFHECEITHSWVISSLPTRLGYWPGSPAWLSNFLYMIGV
jgi:hypothetical protein